MKNSRLAVIHIVLMVVGIQLASAGDFTCNESQTGVTALENQIMTIGSAVEPVAVNACTDITVDLQKVRVGYRCRTSKGKIFTRVYRKNFGKAWKGPDGLIWSDHKGEFTQYDALDTCVTLGGKLPSVEDYNRGRANGLREVLTDMPDYTYWTSELFPERSDLAGFVSGIDMSLGYTTPMMRQGVRCVGR